MCSATYHGSWVANILSNTTEGSKLTEHHGKAKVTAEFTGDRTVTVNLVKGDSVEGTKVDNVGQNLAASGSGPFLLRHYLQGGKATDAAWGMRADY